MWDFHRSHGGTNSKKSSDDYASEVISGSISGILSTITVIAGVVGAGLTPKTVLILGTAVSFTNALNNATATYLAEDLPHFQAATEVFLSSFLVALVPLILYIFEYITYIRVINKEMYSIILAMISMLLVAYFKAEHFTRPTYEIIRNMMFVVGCSAVVSYGIGYALQQADIP